MLYAAQYDHYLLKYQNVPNEKLNNEGFEGIIPSMKCLRIEAGADTGFRKGGSA